MAFPDQLSHSKKMPGEGSDKVPMVGEALSRGVVGHQGLRQGSIWVLAGSDEKMPCLTDTPPCGDVVFRNSAHLTHPPPRAEM